MTTTVARRGITSLLEDEQTSVAAIYELLCDQENSINAELLSAVRSLTLTSARRAALFAALWAAGRRELLKQLTGELPAFTEAAVLSRAATLLDNPRRVRLAARKLDALTAQGARQAKLRRAQQTLATLRSENVPAAFAASRSFKAVLKRFLGAIPADRLEFDLLFFEDGPWVGFSDLAHTKPSDWALPYFAAVCHGASAPEGTLLADVKTLSKATLPALLEKHPRLGECYSHIRTKVPAHERDEACNLALAKAMPMADVLWHYEELGSSGWAAVDGVIRRRLEAGELLEGSQKTDSFGKLVERLLLFRKLGQRAHRASFWPLLMPLAERQLDELKARRLALVRGDGPRSLQELAASSLHDEGGPAALAEVPEAVALSVPAQPALRVAVLGDASSSMQTAIDAATIIGAMMSAIFEAELVFFNHTAFKSSRHATPSSAADVLAVTEEVRAGGATSPAVALLPFYEAKTPVDLFIVVTDEEENTGYDGTRSWGGNLAHSSFAALFERYSREVRPAKLAFVSFLKRSSDEGQMVRDLRSRGITNLSQMRMDEARPDLSKFDAIVGSVMLDAQQAMAARRDVTSAAA